MSLFLIGAAKVWNDRLQARQMAKRIIVAIVIPGTYGSDVERIAIVRILRQCHLNRTGRAVQIPGLQGLLGLFDRVVDVSKTGHEEFWYSKKDRRPEGVRAPGSIQVGSCA